MRRIAVLGAGGFIGNRLVEQYAIRKVAEVVPIVRRPAALALAMRFKLPARIADAFDQGELVAAFEGCTELVCAIAGDVRTIVETVAPVYSAAERAGVRRIVYLSSAVVHGQAPAPHTDETSSLSLDQPFAYNRAKIEAEQLLQDLCVRGQTEAVILRPAIVYGPRSQWTGGFADQLLSRTAFLADGGEGVCNAIYVDNLVHAIDRAIDAERVNGQAFLLNDRETVSWRELVAPIAQSLGISLRDVPQPSSVAVLRESKSISNVVLLPAARAAVRILPPRLAEAQRSLRRAFRRSPAIEKPSLEARREFALLQSCNVRLPSTKAERMLGYDPPVSFEEGCRRSVAWLRFAGYPVR
jgi:nucleoside-diphosphate-sugar epimerase